MYIQQALPYIIPPFSTQKKKKYIPTKKYFLLKIASNQAMPKSTAYHHCYHSNTQKKLTIHPTPQCSKRTYTHTHTPCKTAVLQRVFRERESKVCSLAFNSSNSTQKMPSYQPTSSTTFYKPAF